MALGEGRVLFDDEKRYVLHFSIARNLYVLRSYHAIIKGIESNYLLVSYLIRRAILMTKNAETDEVDAVVGAYTFRELRTFNGPDTDANEF